MSRRHAGTGRRPVPARWRRGPVALWTSLVLCGLTLLPLPFTGDQALYLLYGRGLTHGAVLYRDLWDVKQPGIFWFYGLAAKLFGPSEIGIHLAVVLWWLAGGLLAQRAWRSRLDHRAARTAVPLLTAGVLLATVRPIDLGQVEHLVGLPILAAWWLVQHPDPGTPQGRGRLAGAGAATAVVILFKHLYVAVPGAFLVLALVRLARRTDTRTALRAAAWWIGGLAMVVAPFVAQVVATGQTDRVWWTFTRAAGQTRALDPPPLSRLVRSTARAAVMTLPLLVLAALGRRRAWRPEARNGTVDMLVWIVAGGAALAGQLWWPYQQLLVFVPLGLLAAHGVDELAHRWRDAGTRRSGRVIAVVVALTAVASVAPLAVRASLLARHGLAVTAADRDALRRDAEPAERAAVASAGFLRGPSARPGPVLLLGNPIHLVRAGRVQAGAVHGWSPEFNTPGLWDEVIEAAGAPDVAYVAIDDVSLGFVRERAPGLLTVLETRYRRLDVAPGSGLAWWEPLRPL